MRALLFTLLLASLAFHLEAENEKPVISEKVTQFVEHYCLECHDSDTEKGDRAFEDFLDNPNSQDQHLSAEEILDQLNLGEMPPKKKGVEQPPKALTRKIISELTHYLQHVYASKKPNSTKMRRLTRMEYNNTMRDLLGVNPDQFDATSLFQFEQEKHGFKKNASVQALSNHQLQEYMKAAKAYLDQALVFNQKEPKLQKWSFTPKDFKGSHKIDISVHYRHIDKDNQFYDIGHGHAIEYHPSYPNRFRLRGVPQDGIYKVSVKARSIGLDHSYDPTLVKYDTSKPLEMGLWHVPNYHLLGRSSSEGRVHMDTFTISDQVQTYSSKSWMPKGSSPFVHWINGPGSSKPILQKVQKQYHNETQILSKVDIDQLKESGIEITPAMLKKPEKYLSDVYQGPRIRITHLEIEGPLHDSWPPKSHRMLIGDSTDPKDVSIEETLLKLAKRAFRAEVNKKEVQHYFDYSHDLIKTGHSKIEALKKGMAAILCSPRFLFIDEGNRELSPSLNDREIANRMAYMLWGSMPDPTLIQHTKSGDLSQKLSKEIDRYLNDNRSMSFIKDFSDTWFRLDKIGQMPPSSVTYPKYFQGRLQYAMKQETYHFIQHLIKNNLPIRELIEAEYSFINNHLGEHYGLKHIQGTHFRKVNLPKTMRRNGIIGHASVLTATANGIDTSPVLRGIWVLESLLGTPPTPPPPDVPPIEPDTRGATTIREQLKKHREVTSCADCHANIDPWGFALENFGPIGELRTHYPIVNRNGRISGKKGPEVDSSGETPSGEAIQNETSLANILLKREDQLTRNYITKLLTYATGREMNFRDQPEINQIIETSQKQKLGMRDLIHLVIKSKIFNQR